MQNPQNTKQENNQKQRKIGGGGWKESKSLRTREEALGHALMLAGGGR
jgi:hypothetical protein